MCCTFGDLTDVQWWRELQLPVRTVIGRDGRLHPRDAAVASSGAGADGVRRALAGKTMFCAREAMVGLLRESGDLDGEPTPDHADGQLLREGRQAARDRGDPAVVHPQRRPRRRACATRCCERGAEIDWIPPHMQHRYDNWVGGLNGDWLISPPAVLRHPVPGLVPARRRGRARLRPPAAAARGRAAARPVDRRRRAGYDEDQRGKPGGFVGDPDVMDTWATSSLTPADRRRLAAPTRTCSRGSSRWTCAPTPTTSSAPGCSRGWCARTSRRAWCRGRTR